MNLQYINYILTLAEEKNFSKAAERLFMTQSALSQFVRKQEQQLGITLFNRKNGPVTLTAEGELYVEALISMKTAMMDFENQLSDLTNLRTGKLTIGTSPFRATNLFPQVIKEFTSKYSGIEFEIITDNVKKLTEKLDSGDIDFCIETDFFDKELFHCESLFTETHYLAVPKDHPLNEKLTADALTMNDIGNETNSFFNARPASLAQCTDTKMIGLKPNNSFYKIHRNIFREADFQPSNITLVENIETAFRWVVSGIAITLIPDSLIFHGDFRNHPNYYKLDLDSAHQDIVFAMRSGRYVSAAAKKFLDILRTLIGFGTWNMPH